MVVLVTILRVLWVQIVVQTVLQLWQRRVTQWRVCRVCGRVDGRFALAVLTVRAAPTGSALLTVAVPVMCLDVFRQVVRTHEPLIAYGARKSLLTRMCSQMPLQFIGSRESLATKQPVADKRPLTRMPAQMRLQMRRLPVHFPASRNVAGVDVLLAEVCASWTKSLRFVAVGTVARRSAGVPPLGSRRRHLRQRRLRQAERRAM